VTVMLGDGNPIRLVSAPVFIATKIEAFKGRGKSDYLASHDLEDIITVVDGRESLLNEIAESGGELRDYLKVEIARMLVVDDFLTSLPGQLPADRGSQARCRACLENCDGSQGNRPTLDRQ
jgi:hypothetical protein